MAIGFSFKGLVDNVLNNTVYKNSSTGAANLPAGNTANRPSTQVQGMARYNNQTNEFEGSDGTNWVQLGGGATGSQGDKVFFLNEQTVDFDYTIPTGRNAGSFGTITISNGVTVTVPDGSTWTVA